MRLKITLTVVAALVLLPLASWAEQVTATDTSTGITYTLIYSTPSSGSPYTGAITLTSVCIGTTNCFQNLDAVSVSGATATITAFPAGYIRSSSPGGCSDGFQNNIGNLGSGLACVVQDPAVPGVPPFGETFSISQATDLVFHAAAGSNGCSLWFKFDFNSAGNLTNGVTNNGGATSTPPCGAAVPEPGSLALLGSGLVGAAAYLRRRLLG